MKNILNPDLQFKHPGWRKFLKALERKIEKPYHVYARNKGNVYLAKGYTTLLIISPETIQRNFNEAMKMALDQIENDKLNE